MMIKSAINRFIACESGATAVEYALLVTLLMMSLLAVIGKMTSNMNNMYNRLSNNLT
jgi:Flp pilus assembly pilin Flp